MCRSTQSSIYSTGENLKEMVQENQHVSVREVAGELEISREYDFDKYLQLETRLNKDKNKSKFNVKKKRPEMKTKHNGSIIVFLFSKVK